MYLLKAAEVLKVVVGTYVVACVIAVGVYVVDFIVVVRFCKVVYEVVD